MRRAIAILAVLACTGWCTGAHAQVYRCVAAGGAVSFQDHACARGERQSIVDVPGRGPDAPPPAGAASAPAVAAPAAVPAFVPPPAPLPALYACIGAVNGQRYLARSPPPPYLAPLGVMGYPPLPLSQAYGAEGATRMSPQALAPKVRVGGPSIAAGMTEVEDACAPASHAEVCGYVQREYDDNDRRLRLAMRHEQPPLEQRERELADQLRNCR